MSKRAVVYRIPVDMTSQELDRQDRLEGYKKGRHHWLVRADGTVEPGRPLEEQSPLGENVIAIAVAAEIEFVMEDE